MVIAPYHKHKTTHIKTLAKVSKNQPKLLKILLKSQLQVFKYLILNNIEACHFLST